MPCLRVSRSVAHAEIIVKKAVRSSGAITGNTLALLKHRPRILWIVGPNAFAADPDLVFRVDESGGGIVRLRHSDARQLSFSGDLT